MDPTTRDGSVEIMTDAAAAFGDGSSPGGMLLLLHLLVVHLVRLGRRRELWLAASLGMAWLGGPVYGRVIWYWRLVPRSVRYVSLSPSEQLPICRIPSTHYSCSMN